MFKRKSSFEQEQEQIRIGRIKYYRALRDKNKDAIESKRDDTTTTVPNTKTEE